MLPRSRGFQVTYPTSPVNFVKKCPIGHFLVGGVVGWIWEDFDFIAGLGVY